MAEDKEDAPLVPDSVGDEDTKILNLNIKTTKKKEPVQVAADCTIKKLKEMLSERMEAPVSQQCLIFAGRILKDDETIEAQGIKDGVTIHLVVRSSGAKPSGTTASTPVATTTTSGRTPPATNTTPQSMTGTGGGAGPPPAFDPFGGPQEDLQQQMQYVQQQFDSHPEMMQQLMESPMIQNFLSNPDALQAVLTSNPQMQQLMERNPELSHILHNPELMRQAIEMTRNPAAMREMMRSQDRQLSNIESLPGGFNALARMYTEIQEPMMDAAQESLQQQVQNNPFSALFGQQQATPDPGPAAPQGTTNTDPLPNPWAPPTSRASSSTPRTTGTSSSSTTGGSAAGTGSGNQTGRSVPNPLGAGGLGQGGLQSMMQQMQNNPEMMQQMMQMSGQGGPMAPNPEAMSQMMQSPMFQQTMERMMSNPEMLEQMIRNNPMLAGNPQAAQIARQSAQMMQNTEMREMFRNPEAMRAMMQVQQGMATLQQASPGLFGQGGLGSPASTTAGTGTTPSGTGTTPSTTGTGTTPSTTATGSVPGTQPPPVGVQSGALQQMLAQALQAQSMGGGATTQPPPGGVGNVAAVELQQLQQAEVLYQSQLEQMSNMGFSNRQANLRALVETGGDINAAVNRLIQ